MDATRCPRCSKALPPGVGFCRRCGAAVRPPAAAVPAGRAAGQWYRGLAASLVLVGAVGAVLGLAVLRTSPRPAPPAVVREVPAMPAYRPPVAREPALPPLPALPAWRRHLPAGLPPAGGDRDYRGQLLTQGRFGSRPLGGAVFAGADLLQADFKRADLRNADFRGANLSQTDLAGADLAGVRFDNARLHQASLTGADTAAVAGRTRVRAGITEPVPPPPLVVRNAGRASFAGARFSQVTLDRLDLAGANFRGAEFQQVGLRGADLARADLRDTRHGSTDFADALLDEADLRGADLSSARNLTAAQLAAARTDATTRLPRR